MGYYLFHIIQYLCRVFSGQLLYSFSDQITVVGIVTSLRAVRSGVRTPVRARFSAPVQTAPTSTQSPV
jgi:hypothetical protein